MTSATITRNLVISEMTAPTPQQESTTMMNEDREDIGENEREPLLPKLKKAKRRRAMKELIHQTSVSLSYNIPKTLWKKVNV